MKADETEQEEMNKQHTNLSRNTRIEMQTQCDRKTHKSRHNGNQGDMT